MQTKTNRHRRVVPIETVLCKFCQQPFTRPVNRPFKVHCKNACTLRAFYERELVAAGKTVT